MPEVQQPDLEPLKGGHSGIQVHSSGWLVDVFCFPQERECQGVT